MAIQVRHAVSPDTVETATTTALRDAFVIEKLFVPGEVRGAYFHGDRLLALGAVPVDDTDLALPAPAVLGAATLLEGREAGIVNVGQTGEVLVDGTSYVVDRLDAVYVGRGSEVVLRGSGARFYVVAATAHADHPIAHIRHSGIEPVLLGDAAGASSRGLYRYLWDGGEVATCQLQLGVTVVAQGSVWNTMPAHLHERRTEIYLYTGLSSEARVVHLLGRPGATRHVLLSDEQAVVAPPWSVHAGAGTGSYTFVWAMAGENRAYADLSPVPMDEL